MRPSIRIYGYMAAPRSTVLDRLTALADPTRSRILLLLEKHELTVTELCATLELPQSTVSRHLKLLSDDGWIVARGEATSRFYRMNPGSLDKESKDLWSVVRSQVLSAVNATQDMLRADRVLARRR